MGFRSLRTEGGTRTHTSLRTLDFEPSASTNSATSAFLFLCLLYNKQVGANVRNYHVYSKAGLKIIMVHHCFVKSLICEHSRP